MNNQLWECEAWRARFARQEIIIDHRDDWRCPHCDSVRVLPSPSDMARTKEFLLDYHTL